jgi:hypothetical protein
VAVLYSKVSKCGKNKRASSGPRCAVCRDAVRVRAARSASGCLAVLAQGPAEAQAELVCWPVLGNRVVRSGEHEQCRGAEC